MPSSGGRSQDERDLAKMSGSSRKTFGRDDVLCAARGWIGTPYHHQASCRGIGTDCLGVIRGVYRELLGSEPQLLPAYSRDWAEVDGREPMLEAARLHLCEVPLEAMLPGDVILFRMSRTGAAKHAGVLAGRDTFIHAMERRPVSEVALSKWWRRRLVAAFSFPKIDA